MTDNIQIAFVPAGSVFKGYGFNASPDGKGGLNLYVEWEEPDGVLHHVVVIPDHTQPTGYRIEDTVVVSTSAKFTLSIGTLDERSEQTQT